MASIGDQRLAPRFIELLRHDDYVTRMFAAYALARVGGTQSLPALRRVAEMDPHQVENGVYDVRMAAQNAINQIEGTQPTDTIRKITVNETLN
jgi:HEAT repeat protein